MAAWLVVIEQRLHIVRSPGRSGGGAGSTVAASPVADDSPWRTCCSGTGWPGRARRWLADDVARPSRRPAWSCRWGDAPAMRRLLLGQHLAFGVSAVTDQKFGHSRYGRLLATMSRLLRLAATAAHKSAVRTVSVSRPAKLTSKRFLQNLTLPPRAVAFDEFSGTRKSMAFGRVVADADRQIQMEGTYCDGVRRFQRVVHSRTEIIGEFAFRHAGLLLGTGAQYELGPHHYSPMDQLSR
jgi:hypothetical protein